MTGVSRVHDIGTVLQQAFGFHRSGQFAEAERLYRAVLAQLPEQFDALHLLGVLELQRRNFDAAVQLIGRAATLDPRHAPAHSNLSAALLELKRPSEALASCDRALAIAPDYAEAHINRGNALQATGRDEEAIASYDRALAIKPDNAAVLTRRAAALFTLDRHAEALRDYDRALALDPGQAELLYNRGTVLLRLGRPEEALASYDQALAIRPDHAELHYNRGSALRGLGRPEDALAAYSRAVSIKPGFVAALDNHGTVLLGLKRPAAALASYDAALAIDPAFANALKNRAFALLALQRFEAAARDFQAHLALVPDSKHIRGELLHAKLWCCDWQGYRETAARLVEDVLAGRPTIAPLAFLVVADAPAAQQRCAEIYSRDYCPSIAPPVRREVPPVRDKIRVAYLSADFREHPLTYSTVELFELHDRSKFETIALSFGPETQSPAKARLERAFDRFIDVRARHDRDVALLLADLQIDIAVDLGGYTADCRPGILALRPAPVQISYWGFPGTMGSAHIDYIIADRIVIPEAEQSYYTEKIVYLPDSYLPSDAKRQIGEHTPTRQEAGLPETGFVFCVFNSVHKITPTMFDIWMRLLRQVEGSVLWLVGITPAAMRNLQRSAAERGVSAERLVFAPPAKWPDHLARHRLADLLLDTLPFNAHSTAGDALWMGVPIVTCAGSAFAARVAASVLNAIGLPELVARSLEEYEAIALALARTPGNLAAVKAKLARNRETYPLFDTARLCRHIESAYEAMWQCSLRGAAPASFSVVPRRG
jgi:protein O-GlcNAc transferase